MKFNSLASSINDRVRATLQRLAMGGNVTSPAQEALPRPWQMADGKIALINCYLFDGLHPGFQSGMTILIENGLIVAVEDQQKLGAPENFACIDVAGKTVLPGLIDSHVHLCSPFTYRVNFAAVRQMKKQILLNCRKTIETGITTVCDMGGPWGIIREFRQMAQGDEIVAPRALNCFTLIAPRHGRRLGYPTQVKPLDPVQRWLLEGQVASRPRTIKDLETIIHHVRDCQGDYIKTTCQSQPFSDRKLPAARPLPTFDDDWMRALLRISKEAHMAVCIHAPYAADAERSVDLAIETGTRIRLQHMIFDTEIKKALLGKMQDHGISVIPTVMVYGDAFHLPEFIERFTADADGDLTPEARRQLVAKIRETMAQERTSGQQVLELDALYFRKQFSVVRRNTQRAHEAGVIGFGTDCGGTYTGLFGRLHTEVQHYADFGFDPLDILKYLTSVNARINGLADRGVIRPGKFADLAIIDGEPLTDLSALTRVSSVLKGGKFCKMDEVEFSMSLP